MTLAANKDFHTTLLESSASATYPITYTVFWQAFSLSKLSIPSILKNLQLQEAKGIWRRLHRMTLCTRHVVYTAHAAADLSRVTDRQTDTMNTDNNSQHLMHSMQPKMAPLISVCLQVGYLVFAECTV